MISQNKITEISKREDIGWEAVEKDYFLTLLLEGIANIPELRENFVFKGGTALGKIYFQHYRYSEDLDFTLKKEMDGKEMHELLEAAVAYLKKTHNADLRIRDFDSKKWFTDVKIQFVGLRGNRNTIAMDVSGDEIIVEKAVEKRVMNPYYESTFSVQVYTLEEIMAEKLRGILERTKVRDYYDIWYLLKHARVELDIKKVVGIFHEKVMERKNLKFKGKGQFLEERKFSEAEAYYQRQVGEQLKNPPSFKGIKEDLKAALAAIDFERK